MGVKKKVASRGAVAGSTEGHRELVGRVRADSELCGGSYRVVRCSASSVNTAQSLGYSIQWDLYQHRASSLPAVERRHRHVSRRINCYFYQFYVRTLSGLAKTKTMSRILETSRWRVADTGM